MTEFTVRLVRGPSGCGKTTYVTQNKLSLNKTNTLNAKSVSADDYPDLYKKSNNGELKLDGKLLEPAHKSCMENLEKFMIQNIPIIFVDNTNVNDDDVIRYHIFVLKINETYNLNYKIKLIYFENFLQNNTINKETISKFRWQICKRKTHMIDTNTIEKQCESLKNSYGKTLDQIIYSYNNSYKHFDSQLDQLVNSLLNLEDHGIYKKNFVTTWLSNLPITTEIVTSFTVELLEELLNNAVEQSSRFIVVKSNSTPPKVIPETKLSKNQLKKIKNDQLNEIVALSKPIEYVTEPLYVEKQPNKKQRKTKYIPKKIQSFKQNQSETIVQIQQKPSIYIFLFIISILIAFSFTYFYLF